MINEPFYFTTVTLLNTVCLSIQILIYFILKWVDTGDLLKPTKLISLIIKMGFHPCHLRYLRQLNVCLSSAFFFNLVGFLKAFFLFNKKKYRCLRGVKCSKWSILIYISKRGVFVEWFFFFKCTLAFHYYITECNQFVVFSFWFVLGFRWNGIWTYSRENM